LDLGVNWIDTAPFYGWGRAERIVGKAIQGRREQVYVFTKCGTLPNGRGGWLTDLRPATIRQEVDASLRNLGTDCLDLYQFHDPDPATPIEASWAELHKLVAEGKVRHGGLSNHPVSLVRRAMRVGPVAALQHQYNPLERSIESDILPFAGRHRVGVLGWGSLAEGFLTDEFDLGALDLQDFRRRHPYARPANYTRIRRLVSQLRAIARPQQMKAAQLVIAWELTHPELTGAIVGVRNAREAEDMVTAATLKLGASDMRRIETALRIWGDD
jgi:aryl-alcohol dehydrogenase-like predicted oxidoreductase